MRLVRERNERQRWGYRFLKAHEVKWLTSSSTLREQTALSLKDRVAHFLRQFPEAHLNPTLLSQVYRLHRIKKKKLRWYKVAPNLDEDQRRRELGTMKRALTIAKREGYRIIYLDETMFTRKTVADTEWALPGQNMTVDLKLLDEPTLALLSGVSKERGQEHFRIFARSVTTAKFIEWLEELRALNGTDKIALFMDNLSSHTAEDSK